MSCENIYHCLLLLKMCKSLTNDKLIYIIIIIIIIITIHSTCGNNYNESKYKCLLFLILLYMSLQV